jgi:hypothetical protein
MTESEWARQAEELSVRVDWNDVQPCTAYSLVLQAWDDWCDEGNDDYGHGLRWMVDVTGGGERPARPARVNLRSPCWVWWRLPRGSFPRIPSDIPAHVHDELSSGEYMSETITFVRLYTNYLSAVKDAARAYIRDLVARVA